MWNESPDQARCMIQDARSWCTGMTQRDDMGREVGGGFRMGNMCTPVADACWCMANPIQYCKVKKKKSRRKEMSKKTTKVIYKTKTWGLTNNYSQLFSHVIMKILCLKSLLKFSYITDGRQKMIQSLGKRGIFLRKLNMLLS